MENVVMEQFVSDDDFWRIYEEKYKKIIETAQTFLEQTNAVKEKTIVFMRYVR